MNATSVEARLRFLGDLGEAARDSSDPQQVLALVAERLGQHLQVSRCAYAEVEPDGETFVIRHDYTHDCASTAGTYRLSLFGPRAAADQSDGRTLVVHDVDVELPPSEGAHMFNAIAIKAIICCPLLKDGRLAAMMAVHQTTPRRWTEDEVRLVEQVVARSWTYIEQARARRDLAVSEARFRQLADAMPQIVWTARDDGIIDYYNRRWFEYIGVSEAAIDLALWERHIHPDDLPRVYAAWGYALATRNEYAIEFRLRRASGAYRWFLVRALPIRNAREVVRWIGTCTDIDDKKQAEQALQHSSHQLELVVRAARVGVWYCTLPLDKFIWDATVKEHFHLPPEADVDVELFMSRIHPEDRERTRAAMEHSISAIKPYDIDYRTVSADGQKIKWIRAIGRTFCDEAGVPARFDGVTLDVTDRMQAEQALRESEARFRSMSDSAPVMIWVTRADARCEYLNRRWYEFTGQTEEQAAGFGWLSAVHIEDTPRTAALFMQANAARAPFTVEYRLKRRDGAYRWCVDAATPRFSEDGAFLGYIGSVIDITDRALAEQERAVLLESERAARIEAERASRMKDEFLATLSHELRTPLNAVLGWAHLLGRGKLKPEELTRGLSVIERNARAQAQIIDDLLDMSRIISGKVRLEVAPVDFAALVEAALETGKPAADAKGITVRAELAEIVGLELRADGGRLHQVLWNLLSNAVKFTSRGGQVELTARRLADQVVLQVRDDGIGIAPDFLPHVFDRFRQADASTTRRHGGLGLGLAIVKQLVELHGGTVDVASRGAGKGATFTVRLPLLLAPVGDEPARERTAPRELAPEPLPAVDLTDTHVLVVDDEADARALLERILEERGAAVRVAADAGEALALLACERFDLLISDVGMPTQDGYALLRALRATADAPNVTIPALALTAYVRDEDRARALEAGYQMHLAKPLEPARLLAAVANVLRSDRAR